VRAARLLLGSAGEAAIYTEHFRELSLLRKSSFAHAQLAELHLPRRKKCPLARLPK
jgi:hypothetical protein